MSTRHMPGTVKFPSGFTHVTARLERGMSIQEVSENGNLSARVWRSVTRQHFNENGKGDPLKCPPDMRLEGGGGGGNPTGFSRKTQGQLPVTKIKMSAINVT